MKRIFRYSLGVGLGCFLLALLNGYSLEQSAILAGTVVAIGWVLWGGIALSTEYQKAAIFFAEMAAVGIGVLVKKPAAPALEAPSNGRQHQHPNGLVKPPATRKILVNDAGGSHYIIMEEHSPYRRQVILFLALGGRGSIQSFVKRDMVNYTLSNGDLVDFDLWRRITDDLVLAGLFFKDRRNGTRPRRELSEVLSLIENGAALASEPVNGTVITDPAEGYQNPSA